MAGLASEPVKFRVLLSAPNEKPWSFGRHLYVALRSLGHDVELFDYCSSPDPDSELLRTAETFRPGLHVAWKGELYHPRTFRALAARGIYNVLWHPDISVPHWLPPLARASDLCCVQSRGMLARFRAAGINDPQWLMEGITPSYYCFESMTPAEELEYSCDVVLIGTLRHPPEYRPRLVAMNRLAREGMKIRWWGPRMPRRLNMLFDWLSPAGRAWGGRNVWNKSYAKACRAAKICLRLPGRPEAEGGLSSGAFMATGVGAFLLSLYRKGMEEFFDLRKEVVVFRSEAEMVEKVHYYLEHDAERAAIAKAGQQRTLGNYTNQHAFNRLFDLIATRRAR
jgi:hypothetical protein